MEREKIKGIIEAVLFAAGKEVTIKELQLLLEKPKEEIEDIILEMNQNYKKDARGIEILKVEESYQLASKTVYYEYIIKIIDKRNKPKLSNAALETLAIIAYNPGISRAEIEAIRGVNVDGTMYKLLEYGLIEEAGKLELPGKPMSYKTTTQFLKMFGYKSLNDLPELPKYKMDENHQIVLEDLIEEQFENNTKEEKEKEINKDPKEAPSPKNN